VSGQNSSERSKGQQKQEGAVDVLDPMLVTAAVFQFEMSALNARALENAVGGCWCRVMVDTIQIKIKSRKRKKENQRE
jgi:hypothetical protein